MKTKIAIFQYDLGVGGIQRSLINLLNSLSSQRYDIDLYIFSRNNPFREELPDSVKVVFVKEQAYFKRFIPFSLYFLLKRVNIDKQYDIAIDFNGHQNITAAYALRVKAKRHIYWAHNDHYMWRAAHQHSVLKKIYSHITLSRNKWKRFDEFVGVSNGVLNSFKNDFPNKKYWTIPNLINSKFVLGQSKEKVDFKVDSAKLNIVTVGRLEYEKGIDIFLPQLAYIVERRPGVHFYIIGGGSCEKPLEALVKKLDLNENVTFLGAQSNPFKYLVQMDMFILSSRYEGQGMVLREAEVLGLQILFPKRLEKYNDGLTGSDNLTEDILSAQRKPHKTNYLLSYNKDIKHKLNQLFDCSHSDRT